MAARPIGSATVSFGLVSIPTKVYSSTDSAGKLSFNMLNRETGARLKQQYVDSNNGELVPRSQMARGYEFAKGQYVMFSDEEYKALQEVANNTISLVEFVPAEAIDPVYYSKAYYLGPDKGGARAYKLLGEAMRESGLVGLANYSARGKQYLVMIRPIDGGLAMQQLHFSDQLRNIKDVPIDDNESVDENELTLAKQIIQQIASDQFEPTKYRDDVRDRMMELIEQKVAGQEITMTPEASPQAQVIDLMDALKQSLGGDSSAAKAHKPARSATAAPKKEKSSASEN